MNSAPRQTVAVVGGGVAALLTRAAFAYFNEDLAERTGDPREIRLVVAVVYSGVILALDRHAFQVDPTACGLLRRHG